MTGSRSVTPHPATHGGGVTDVARLRVALFKLAALLPVQVPGGLADHEVAELLVAEFSAVLDAVTAETKTTAAAAEDCADVG